jgi:hypothetical protein
MTNQLKRIKPGCPQLKAVRRPHHRRQYSNTMQIPKSAFAVVFLKSNASEAQIFPFCQFLLEETFEKPFVTQNKSYPYDLILFPHIIEICLNYICENFNLNSTKFYQYSTTFLKRIIYLLQTSNINSQIIIKNVGHLFQIQKVLKLTSKKFIIYRLNC